MKKVLTFCFLLFTINVNAMEKETTFKKELFDKAQSEGKVVVVSSWIKYCTSCASQMKVLNKAKNDFKNIEYFSFDVTNKDIANLFEQKNEKMRNYTIGPGPGPPGYDTLFESENDLKEYFEFHSVFSKPHLELMIYLDR